MNDLTLLLRQVHPSFFDDGKITSQVFRPTPKDENKLSVDNGDKISAKESYQNFTAQQNCHSMGVLAISKQEINDQQLPLIEDGVPNPEHCSISFENLSKGQIEKKAKFLKNHAEKRGWLFEHFLGE